MEPHSNGKESQLDEHTTIPIEAPVNKNQPHGKDFPEAPFSVDDYIKTANDQKSKKLKKRSRSRQRTCDSEPAQPTYNHSRRYSQVGIQFIHDRMEQLKEIKMPKITTFNPTKLPLIERWITYGRKKWPGHRSFKKILYSPYFFLYIISMSLIQAFVAGVAPPDYSFPNGMDLSRVISLSFFVLYLVEVVVRLFIKGFDFFLSFYNLAEVSLTLSAFILDFFTQGTSFVAMVLSLRVVWCIHKVPGMTFIVEGIKLAAPRISIILFPILIVTYVFAVITTNFFGPASFDYPSENYWMHSYQNGTTITLPGASLPYNYYGNIARSMFTLFQVMTGDAWADQVTRPTLAYRPWAWVLFIIFYALSAFVLMNIFTGIMVDAIQSYEAERRFKKDLEKNEKKAVKDKKKFEKETANMKSKLGSLEVLTEDESSCPPSPAPLHSKRGSVSEEFKSGDTLVSVESGQGGLIQRDRFAKVVQTNIMLKEIQSLREENKRLNAKVLAKLILIETKLGELGSA